LNDSGVAVPSRDLVLKDPLGALRFARLISRTHQALDGRKDLLSQENIAEARELAGRWLPLVNPNAASAAGAGRAFARFHRGCVRHGAAQALLRSARRQGLTESVRAK